MFGLLALALFVIAAILELTGKHLDWVIWLIIFGGIFVALHTVWGWAPWAGRTGTAP